MSSIALTLIEPMSETPGKVYTRYLTLLALLIVTEDVGPALTGVYPGRDDQASPSDENSMIIVSTARAARTGTRRREMARITMVRSSMGIRRSP